MPFKHIQNSSKLLSYIQVIREIKIQLTFKQKQWAIAVKIPDATCLRGPQFHFSYISCT